MSRPRVVSPISRRLRHQSTLDVRGPPSDAKELAADIMRVKARLAQRAAAKVSEANVAAKRQEVPRVPRVARQRWQHAHTLESKESSLKGMCHCNPHTFDCILLTLPQPFGTQFLRDLTNHAQFRAYSQRMSRRGEASLRVPRTFVSHSKFTSFRRRLIHPGSGCRAHGSQSHKISGRR